MKQLPRLISFRAEDEFEALFQVLSAKVLSAVKNEVALKGNSPIFRLSSFVRQVQVECLEQVAT